MKDVEWEQPEVTREVAVRKDDEDYNFPLITDEQIAQAEKSVEAIKRIKAAALRVTGPRDWVDMGGNPYLQESGCMKVASLFGVSFVGAEVEQSEEKLAGKTIIRFNAKVTAEFNGRKLQIEGTASSDDDFFGKRKGEEIPLQEINLNNVRKKSLTNAQSRALKKILGLGGLTWDDVRGSGVQQEAASSVRYSGQRASGAGQGNTQTKTKIGNMLADLAEYTGRTAEELCHEHSGFQGKDGKMVSRGSPSELSNGWAGKTLAKVEDAWNAMQAEVGGSPRAPGEDG